MWRSWEWILVDQIWSIASHWYPGMLIWGGGVWMLWNSIINLCEDTETIDYLGIASVYAHVISALSTIIGLRHQRSERKDETLCSVLMNSLDQSSVQSNPPNNLYFPVLPEQWANFSQIPTKICSKKQLQNKWSCSALHGDQSWNWLGKTGSFWTLNLIGEE